jgi:crotonobetainyl-CoA:carnitine CoA-transferase CaiB-like acyl-CoA transferase
MMNKPLAGFTLLDVGTMTPGKYCSYLLGDLGADVIRIERPVSKPGPVDDEDLVLNQGKRSITLNLRSDAGRSLYLQLAEAADVILEGNRPGSADRNGYGWSAIKARNPRIIYCALSGYGATGPLSQAPGYDLIFAAQSGMLRALTGKAVPPPVPGAYLVDAVSGLTAAYAIVTALLGRERSGEGACIDLAMHDSIFALLAVSHGLQRRDSHSENGVMQPITPTYDLYEAADDTCVALGAIRPASAQALFEKLGKPSLGDRNADAGEVKSFLVEAFLSKSADAWVAELAPLDIEIARVNDPMEAYEDPQLRARGMIAASTHPEAGEIDSIQPPVRLKQSGQRDAPVPARRIGADTEAILKSLGLDERRVNELRKEGIV